MIGDRLYRTLLRLLPGDFDREEMWETYRARIAGAARRAGRRGATRERIREVLDLLGTVLVERWPLPSFDSFAQDARTGFRSLRRSPLASGLAILSLALGIGATTALFSIADPFLLRPLPLPNADRLVGVWMASDQGGGFASFTVRDYSHWAQATRSVTLMAYAPTNHNLRVDDRTERVAGLLVSANALEVLGIVPALGRGFSAEEGTPAGQEVALLANAFWRDAFGADPDVVGTTLVLDGVAHTVVGVLPPRQGIPGMEADVWTPLRISGAEPPLIRFLRATALLGPGVDIDVARSELGAVAASMADEEGSSLRYARVVPFRDVLYGADERGAALVVVVCALLVLLIACANIANILLARGLTRTREMAVRGALGAGRRRLFQQLLVESVILAVVGAGVGVGLGYVGVDLLRRYVVSPDMPGAGAIAVDARVLTVAALLTGFSLLLFGLVPAARASSFDVRGRLAEGGRAGVSRSRSRLASALVVGEIAATLVLVTFTGLLVRSLVSAQRVDLQMRSTGALVFRLQTSAVSPAGMQLDSQRVVSLYEGLADRLDALPGVTGVATTSGHFLSFWSTAGYSVGDQPDAEARSAAEYRAVTPPYVDLMQLHMVAGRWFQQGVDEPGATPVAVVSRALAMHWWNEPSEALGQTLRMGTGARTIVGVVDPGRMRGPVESPPPAIFVPFAQAPARSTFNVMVHSMDEAAAAAAVRSAVHELDPGLAVFDLRSIESLRDDSLGPVTAGTRIFAALGALALLLTLGGVYGVVAHSVARRTHEMGVRLALGARPRSVVGDMVWKSARLALVGVAIGVVVSLAGGQVMAFFLYSVSARDPSVLVTVPLLLVGVVLLASYLPARRAASIDPVATLRAE